MSGERDSIVPGGSLVERVTGAAMVSWPVAAVVVLWSSILALLGGGSAVSGSPVIRAILGALSGLAAFGLVAVVWWLLIRRLAGIARLVAAVGAILLAGIARGLVMQIGLTAFDFADSSAATLATRLANGVATIPVAFLISAAAVSALRAYRQTASALVAEQARLVVLLEESTRIIEERQVDAVERVRSRLDEELHAVPTDSAPAAVAALEALVGDVVRPLSHSLARDLPEWQAEVVTEAPRIRWIDVWRAPDVRVAIQPVVLPVACLIVAIPASFLLLQPRYGIPAMVAAIAILTVCLFVGRWLLRRVALPSPALTWVAITAVLAVSSAAVSLGVATIASADPSAGVFIGPGTFAVIVFGLLIATAAMMRARMRESTDQLRSVARNLRWTLARVNTQQWEQAGRLSRALHGPVQTLIHATVMGLRQQLESGDVTAEEMHSLRDELQLALTSALAPVANARDVAEVLSDVTVTWSGVAEVSVSIADEASELLSADSLCALATTDLAAEAVSNAVRHGRARRVNITVAMDAADLVSLVVTDDGIGAELTTPGLGTTWLNRCTYDWELRSTVPTALTARLPCTG